MNINSSLIIWQQNNTTHSATWQSEANLPPPKKVIIVDDTTKANQAYQFACEGTGLLYVGDFQNAKQLLHAMTRRIAKKTVKLGATAAESFHFHRQTQSQRSRILGMLLIQVNKNFSIPLRRAPDVTLACQEVFNDATTDFVISMRELLGLIGAHEWRKNGVFVRALDKKIFPYYGVFSPVRGEYLELIEKAPLPTQSLAFDIGTGTGVIAALLAKRGLEKVIATDQDPRALACAHENISKLGYSKTVDIIEANLFPPRQAGRAPLIVCNPPWVPAKPTSPIENAVYDYESRMLKGFLAGLKDHLDPKGEAWLIISDLAEHLGLRSRDDLLTLFSKNGLKVLEKIDTNPKHQKASDPEDLLYQARSKEVTSLWRLTFL